MRNFLRSIPPPRGRWFWIAMTGNTVMITAFMVLVAVTTVGALVWLTVAGVSWNALCIRRA